MSRSLRRRRWEELGRAEDDAEGKQIQRKAHECERMSPFKRSPIYLGTGYAGVCWEKVPDMAGELKGWDRYVYVSHHKGLSVPVFVSEC